MHVAIWQGELPSKCVQSVVSAHKKQASFLGGGQPSKLILFPLMIIATLSKKPGPSLYSLRRLSFGTLREHSWNTTPPNYFLEVSV